MNPAPRGQDINEIIGNDDTIVEFEITNNRPDCYSLLGLARESAAAFNLPMHHHTPVVKGRRGRRSARAAGRGSPGGGPGAAATRRGMVRNVKIGPSPKWWRQRLRAAGSGPSTISSDITNYVMDDTAADARL